MEGCGGRAPRSPSSRRLYRVASAASHTSSPGLLPRPGRSLVAPKAHLHPGVSSPPQSPIPGMSAGVRTAYALESAGWSGCTPSQTPTIATDLAQAQYGRTRGPHAAAHELWATLSWPPCCDTQLLLARPDWNPCRAEGALTSRCILSTTVPDSWSVRVIRQRLRYSERWMERLHT